MNYKLYRNLGNTHESIVLAEETKGKPQLQYPKDKSRLPSGFLTDANMDSILNAMK